MNNQINNIKKRKMDKNSKFEYMQTIENYMEEYQVYELFENLLQ